MNAADTGFLAGQECRVHLKGVCAKGEGSDCTSCIPYATRGDCGHIDNVDDLRDERQCAHERMLRGAEECPSMPSGFKTGSDDGVDAGLLMMPFIRHSSNISRGGIPK